jgi:hypothetical protein
MSMVFEKTRSSHRAQKALDLLSGIVAAVVAMLIIGLPRMLAASGL